MWAEVDDQRRAVVHLEDLAVNCCPSPGATFTDDGGDVVLDFASVTGTSVCDCACIIDFAVTSAPFDAGAYALEVNVDGQPLGEVDLVVP